MVLELMLVLMMFLYPNVSKGIRVGGILEVKGETIETQDFNVIKVYLGFDQSNETLCLGFIGINVDWESLGGRLQNHKQYVGNK
jgi:hypothetical protein